jgi:hypothetical protein
MVQVQRNMKRSPSESLHCFRGFQTNLSPTKKYSRFSNQAAMSIISPPATDCHDVLGLDPCLFCVSNEVAHAVRSGFPVVALESTIITHGLPFPTNYETALAAERRIRDRGALPATVAIVNGVVHVGASEEVCMWCIRRLSIAFEISA